MVPSCPLVSRHVALPNGRNNGIHFVAIQGTCFAMFSTRGRKHGMIPVGRLMMEMRSMAGGEAAARVVATAALVVAMTTIVVIVIDIVVVAPRQQHHQQHYHLRLHSLPPTRV